MKTNMLIAGALLLGAAAVYADSLYGRVYCAPKIDDDGTLKTECANAPDGPGSQDDGDFQVPGADWNGSGGIVVSSASYGRNCGASFNNVGYDVGVACGGAKTCDYTVDYRVLGDPAPGCAKKFQAQYFCQATKQHKMVTIDAEAGFGSIAHFSCE